MASQPKPMDDATLNALVNGIVSDLTYSKTAKDSLDSAKQDFDEKSGMSIKAIARRLAQSNRRLDPTLAEDIKKIDTIAERIAKEVYFNPSKPESNSWKVQKSKLKSLIGQGQHLTHIITGLEKLFTKMRDTDPKVSLPHLSATTIRVANILRDDPDMTVTEAIRKLDLDKAPPTDDEKARSHIDRGRRLEAFLDKVGDEKLIKPAAQKAFDMLDRVLDGADEPGEEHGEEHGEDPRILELEGERDALRARVAALEAAMRDSDLVVEAFDGGELPSEPDDSPVEPLRGPVDGDEKSVVLDTSETPTATPEPAHSVSEASAAIRKAAIGGSLTGFEDIEDLMAALSPKPKG